LSTISTVGMWATRNRTKSYLLEGMERANRIQHEHEASMPGAANSVVVRMALVAAGHDADLTGFDHAADSTRHMEESWWEEGPCGY
jgi:hypothetical protein